MDLQDEILAARTSKRQTLRAVDLIGSDADKFSVLLRVFLSKNQQAQQAAAWVLMHCSDRYPWLILPHIKVLVNNLSNPVHDAIKRATMRSLQKVDIPKKYWGETLDVAFGLMDNDEAVAIRIFAMSVIYNISKVLPEIGNELKLVIEDQLPYGSPGFINRGKKILAKIDQRQREKSISEL